MGIVAAERPQGVAGLRLAPRLSSGDGHEVIEDAGLANHRVEAGTVGQEVVFGPFVELLAHDGEVDAAVGGVVGRVQAVA